MKFVASHFGPTPICTMRLLSVCHFATTTTTTTTTTKPETNLYCGSDTTQIHGNSLDERHVDALSFSFHRIVRVGKMITACWGRHVTRVQSFQLTLQYKRLLTGWVAEYVMNKYNAKARLCIGVSGSGAYDNIRNRTWTSLKLQIFKMERKAFYPNNCGRQIEAAAMLFLPNALDLTRHDTVAVRSYTYKTKHFPAREYLHINCIFDIL